VSRLSEETPHIYSLAISGKFLWEGFKFFSTLVNKSPNPDKITSKIAQKTKIQGKVKIGTNLYTNAQISAILDSNTYDENFTEEFYELETFEDWNFELATLWTKTLTNFLSNAAVVKHLCTGRLDLLKDFLIVFRLMIKDLFTEEKKTETQSDSEIVMLKKKFYEILEKLFHDEISVTALMSHRFIPHYCFHHLFESACWDLFELDSYVEFLCRIINKSDFVTTKNLINYSNYITGILNRFIAEIIWYKIKMQKSLPFNFTEEFRGPTIDHNALEEIVDKFVDLFTYCTEKLQLAKNFGVCLRENGFDL
jgi:hypothetical protein